MNKRAENEKEGERSKCMKEIINDGIVAVKSAGRIMLINYQMGIKCWKPTAR